MTIPLNTYDCLQEEKNILMEGRFGIEEDSKRTKGLFSTHKSHPRDAYPHDN